MLVFGYFHFSSLVLGASLQIQITPKVAGESLQPASFRYQTSAGETFSITRVSYLVSDFGLQRNDGSWLEISNSVAWLDYEQNRDSIRLELPPGEFTTAEFSAALAASEKIGAELAQTISNFLRECDERKFSPSNPDMPVNAANRALQIINLGEQQRQKSEGAKHD